MLKKCRIEDRAKCITSLHQNATSNSLIFHPPKLQKYFTLYGGITQW